jgi:hypothetical protein
VLAHRGLVSALDAIEQQAHAALGQLLARLRHGGQRDPRERAHGDAVEADQRHVARDGDA